MKLSFPILFYIVACVTLECVYRVLSVSRHQKAIVLLHKEFVQAPLSQVISGRWVTKKDKHSQLQCLRYFSLNEAVEH